MSTTTTRLVLAPATGRAAPDAQGAFGTEAFRGLRATFKRASRLPARAAEFVETYSVIEGACLLAAMAFAGVVIAAGFGVDLGLGAA